MEVDRDAERPLCRGHAGDVINMRMRQQDGLDRQRFLLGKREQPRDFVARIDQHGLLRARTSHHEAVLEERTDGLRLDYDHIVILAILDDLMFTSKIKTTAGRLGVPVVFARSSDSAMAGMRSERPAIVILDLNNQRTDPLGTVARMREDASLAEIPTVGFVSHVDSVTIEAARKAGVEVLARSAFTERLPEILARGK